MLTILTSFLILWQTPYSRIPVNEQLYEKQSNYYFSPFQKKDEAETKLKPIEDDCAGSVKTDPKINGGHPVIYEDFCSKKISSKKGWLYCPGHCGYGDSGQPSCVVNQKNCAQSGNFRLPENHTWRERSRIACVPVIDAATGKVITTKDPQGRAYPLHAMPSFFEEICRQLGRVINKEVRVACVYQRHEVFPNADYFHCKTEDKDPATGERTKIPIPIPNKFGVNKCDAKEFCAGQEFVWNFGDKYCLGQCLEDKGYLLLPP